MTLRIRAIHACRERSDVLARRTTFERKTEELRTEIEREKPVLFWPIKKGNIPWK